MISECPLNVDDIQLLSDFPLKANTTKDFFKQFKFSPDGLQILASTENNYLRTWDFDQGLINGSKYYRYAADTDDDRVGNGTMTPYQEVHCGESIYDFQWYPFMNLNESASCCFITTCRDHPIHLWDSVIGQIRCSYSCYNAMDELEAANCVTFNLTGDKIYSGSNRMIRSFDVANPGRSCMMKPTCKTRKDKDGQRGIISTLEFNPDYSGAYAAGSYAHNISVYAENARDSVLELDMEFGVTCLKWSPCGCKLWAGGRGHPDLVCWDLRNTRTELGRVKRPLNSNQKMTFALDPWGKYLATGTQDGQVLLYDTSTFELVEKLNKGLTCVNAVGFHPFSALLVSTSGERQFDYVGEDSGTDSDTDSEGCRSDRDGKRPGGASDTAVDTIDSVCSSSPYSAHSMVAEKQEQEQGQGQGSSKISGDERDNRIERKRKKCKPSPCVRVPPPPSGIQVWSVRRNPIVLPDLVVEVVPTNAVLTDVVIEVVSEIKPVEELIEVAKEVVSEVVAVTSESPVGKALSEIAMGGGGEGE